jgi:hypothetical protein
VELGLSHQGKNLDFGVFENMVLGRILGIKGKEVIGGRRKLQNQELHDCTLHKI